MRLFESLPRPFFSPRPAFRSPLSFPQPPQHSVRVLPSSSFAPTLRFLPAAFPSPIRTSLVAAPPSLLALFSPSPVPVSPFKDFSYPRSPALRSPPPKARTRFVAVFLMVIIKQVLLLAREQHIPCFPSPNTRCVTCSSITTPIAYVDDPSRLAVILLGLIPLLEPLWSFPPLLFRCRGRSIFSLSVVKLAQTLARSGANSRGFRGLLSNEHASASSFSARYGCGYVSLHFAVARPFPGLSTCEFDPSAPFSLMTRCPRLFFSLRSTFSCCSASFFFFFDSLFFRRLLLAPGKRTVFLSPLSRYLV